MNILVKAAAVLSLAAAQMASAQSSSRGLQSANWADRASAFSALQHKTANLLLPLLKRENGVIASTLREADSQRGVSEKYGEGYAEYYEDLLLSCDEVCDKRDPAVIKVLAEGAYTPSSPFAQKLAEEHGALVLQVMVGRAQSDIVIHRQVAVQMLEATGRMSRELSMQERGQLHRAVISAAQDPSVAVRLVAIDAIASVGAPSDVKWLRRIADGTVTLRSGQVRRASPAEREAARVAIARVGHQ